jgi:transcriptional regulator with XRE-family HTH domain
MKKTELAKRFGKLLRERRDGAGLSQQTLAERAGLSYGSLSRMETGKQAPSLETVERLARALEISTHELIPE